MLMITKLGYLNKEGSFYRLKCNYCSREFLLAGFKYNEGAMAQLVLGASIKSNSKGGE